MITRSPIQPLQPHHDGEIGALWRARLDTCDIARRLGLLEWQVANRLIYARQRRSLTADVFGDPPSGRSVFDQKVRGEA